MRRAIWVLWLTLAPALIGLIVPGAVQAHEGQGFHPEALWALLQTGLLVVVAVSTLIGALWLYERTRSRSAK